LDSIITNSYSTTNVSSIIDGGAYYDTYSSHAPEELVPGVTYDNLNMLVTTSFSSNTIFVSYRIVQNMNGNAASTNTALWPKYYAISPSHETVLTANLNVTDSNIYVANVLAISAPNMTTMTPGTVFINGEKIVFWGIDYNSNMLYNIRRAVDGTGAANVYPVGTQVIDTGIGLLIPGGNAVHKTSWLNLAPGAPQDILDNLNDQLVDNLGNFITTFGTSANAVTDGTGLGGSTTEQALFIKTIT
jgi:hypothetical protein